ncbi:MAG: tRNA (adenosine(37)-N6)-threonylcarbamoyltransferase complex ATPase subunit type 1 TsaE [candidate division KSB1 bacterium]|nr:tRNA (adenosine(37)-N6)-threonylcarbamoyltransferase complex ATPase subunit type 1 TsaE [candidate division KSB1 bacterium]
MISTTELRAVLAGETIFTILSHSVEQTHAFASRLEALLQSGEVVALLGDLGSGKTTFVQGFCAAAGVSSPVTSPTFTLMHIYHGRQWRIYHFDFYRLASAREAQELGCQEYFDGDGVCLIEWPDRALALLPPKHLQIHFRIPDFAGSPNLREIKIQRAVIGAETSGKKAKRV